MRKPLITVYGPSKTGKTTFATSGQDTLLLDLEDGAYAVDCETVRVKSWADLAAALDKAAKQKPQVLAVDSLTVAYQHALAFIGRDKDDNGAQTLDLTAPRSQPSLQQFGHANELMKNLILKLRAMPFTVVCTAQERVQYLDSITGADLGNDVVGKEAVIDLPNGARSFVVMYSDVLGYTHISADDDDKPQYRLWLQPTPGLVTGFRSRHVPKLPYLPKPTIARLGKYMGSTTNNK